MKSISIKYLPWSPGIPWKTKGGRYLIPELSINLLHSALKGKDIAIVGFEGFLESFYSLSLLEILNNQMLSNKKYWIGNDKYYSLLSANGLAKPMVGVFKSDLERFTTPIFFDKNNRVYFNYLNNYINVKTYYLTGGYTNNKSAVQQIINNCTIPNVNIIVPKIRYNEDIGNFDDLFKSHRIDLSRPYILFIPDKTSLSNHDQSFIDWNEYQNKSFITLAVRLGLQVIVLTEGPQKYWGMNAKIIPMSVEIFMTLAPKAKFIISKDVDYSIIACSFGKPKIIANYIKGCLNIVKNNNVIGQESVIYTEKEYSPVSAINVIKEST